MMKKITFLFTMLFLFTFSWQGIAQLTEDFETAPPTGWVFVSTEADDPGFVQTTSQAHSGSASYYHNDDNIAAESTSYMISPAYTVLSGDELKFWYYQNFSGSFYTYSGVWISTSSADPINSTDFSELHEFGANGSEDSWSELTFDLSSYVGETIYIAFKYTGDYADEIYIDDFSIASAPSCAAPTNLAVDYMLENGTAGFSWYPIPEASGYNFEIQPQGTPQGNPGAVSSGSTSGESFNAVNLVAGTDYTLYLQTDCGAGDVSSYVSLNFTFAPPPANDNCASATPYIDSFTMYDQGACSGNSNTLDLSYAEEDTTDYPSCDLSGNYGVWYTWTATAPGLTFTSGTGAPGFAVYEAGTCGSLTGVACLNNASGEITNLTVGNDYLFFLWDDTQGANDDFCIELITCLAPSDLTTINITDTSAEYDWTENGSATAWNFEMKAGADFTPGNGEYDVSSNTTIHPFSPGNTLQPETTYYWYVQANCGDTSEWVGSSFTTLETCPAPSGLTTINITDTSAEYDWTENGSATAWNFEMKAGADFTPGNSEYDVSSNTTIHPFSPGTTLQPETTYYWYVQANCGGGETSEWVGPATFYTGYCQPEVTTGTETYIDSFATTGGNTNISNTSTGFSTDNYGNYYDTMSVSLAAEQSFDFTAEIVGGTVGCAIWVDWNSDLEFDVTTENVFQNGSYASGPFTGTITVPSGTADGDYRMRIMIDYNDSLIDDDACTFNGTRGEVEDYKIIVDSALSIANNLIEGFNMYPNPVTNTLNLKAQNNIDAVSIYNMLGQEVLRNAPSATQVQMDMSMLPTGSYIVKVQSGEQVGSYNLLKQ